MKQITLSDFQKGAIPELFENELQKVLENIADINTKPKATRKIKIELSITPDKTRKTAETKLSVTSTLAPGVPSESFLFFDTDAEGKTCALEDDPGPELPGISEEQPLRLAKSN
ncbi:hypothetical protein K7I13_12030 [Brucepastera parasyntrophica]|uniref:hypothetical protein n=1 Tax=Brucepastera parasyntrophica TaxID=2880008 RepID=UPI00210EF604|nr:hypothetical protein [Brucepastera parasyntrophica]ULQ59215.1 hypothetical protein K7I13_12030 [Brucepastera parasyntrophica]